MRRLSLTVAVTMFLSSIARPAYSDDPPPDIKPAPKSPEPGGAPVPLGTPDPNAPPSAEPSPSFFDALVDANMVRTWRDGKPRPFVASTVDLGFLYLRPRATLGYGKPHSKWVGIDANPIISREMWGFYGGMRMAFPHFELRAGARYSTAFTHSYLTPSPSISRLSLESSLGAAHAMTLESEANAQIPVGPGHILLLTSVGYVSGVPAGSYILEETFRIVVAPPWIVRGRAGYAIAFGSHDQVSVALVSDVVGVPERRTVVVRAGALIRFALSRTFELRGTFVPRLLSPDDIGLLDSDFTELGLRWRWATD